MRICSIARCTVLRSRLERLNRIVHTIRLTAVQKRRCYRARRCGTQATGGKPRRTCYIGNRQRPYRTNYSRDHSRRSCALQDRTADNVYRCPTALRIKNHGRHGTQPRIAVTRGVVLRCREKQLITPVRCAVGEVVEPEDPFRKRVIRQGLNTRFELRGYDFAALNLCPELIRESSEIGKDWLNADQRFSLFPLEAFDGRICMVVSVASPGIDVRLVVALLPQEIRRALGSERVVCLRLVTTAPLVLCPKFCIPVTGGRDDLFDDLHAGQRINRPADFSRSTYSRFPEGSVDDQEAIHTFAGAAET